MTLLEWTPISGLRYAPPSRRRESRQAARQNEWSPATDIFETESDYVLKMEVPGFKKNDMQIEFKEGILSVKGEGQEDTPQGAEYHRSERHHGSFFRSFRFPGNVDGKKINAKLKDGILELKIAKPENEKPKQIEVKVN